MLCKSKKNQDLTQQERDLEEMRQAIRALPGPTELTEADRPAVLEARRMAEAVMARYGLTKADLCGVTVVLDLALHALGLPPLADEVTALPPTGGLLPVSAGLISLLAGAAFLIPRKRA